MADREFRLLNVAHTYNQLTIKQASIFVGIEPIVITEKSLLAKQEACFDKNRARFSNDRNKKPILGNLKDIKDQIV